MATIYIDGQPYEVRDGQNLLHACLTLGFDIPYFCWHPAMHSVGACRLCAVKQFKDEHDTRGRIVMSCMTPAADGTRISIEDEEARAFRKSVIEYVMVNHPHDCPVCDEGGECHLQDMTVMTGHTYREFRFTKRTHRNQYLGPFVDHEMNRCIACYRCVRFYRDFAGGRDFDVFGSHHYVYFGRHRDGVLESEFSGNLVEVCPTGVFTDKTFKRHFTRNWDLQTAPSICVHCGVGCNTIPGERYGMLRRIRNRYSGEVNGFFLCDRGRFGYEFVNNELRIRRPMVRREGATAELAGRREALDYAGEILRNSKGIVGIGSPRASVEANFALRALVGPERFCQGMSERDCSLTATALGILRKGPVRTPSLQNVAGADAALILGEDVTNIAPMLALALRWDLLQKGAKIARALQIPAWDDAAVREAEEAVPGTVSGPEAVLEAARPIKADLYMATPHSTKLDDMAAGTYYAAPDDLARLGFAMAHVLDPNAPDAPGLPEELRRKAETVAAALKRADSPLVLSGVGCESEAVMHAAANVAWALCACGREAALCFTMPECNTLGVALMGGGSIEAALEALRSGAADTVAILENDLYRRADAATVDALLGTAKHVLVLDHLVNATVRKAEVVFPAATFAEADGTLVNNEGRAQRFFKVMAPAEDVQESWKWLRDMMAAAGRAEAGAWETLDDVTAALAEAMPAFRAAAEVAPSAGFRVAGLKIPRQPHRYSGRTAMTANITVHEPPPPGDNDSALAFSMEGYHGVPPPALIPRLWAPGWNSVQAFSRYQAEVGGPLKGGDPGKRMIEVDKDAKIVYFTRVPDAFRRREGEWLVVPLHHIFGSEELSILSPGIAELAPTPYVALSANDAGSLGVSAGEEVEVSAAGMARRLPVKVVPSLPEGIAGLPAGLKGTEGLAWGRWGKMWRSGKVEARKEGSE